MKRSFVVLALCAAVVAAPIALAQDNAAGVAEVQALRTAAQKDKRALVTQILDLTPAEAKKFWPIYDTYQADLANYQRQRNTALELVAMQDKPMTNRYARNLANELLGIEEQEIKSRRKMHNAVMKALPPKKAAQYLQVEAKLRAYQAYEIAIAFPLEK
jgi:Spy/CpxP family protein refolding chaperone